MKVKVSDLRGAALDWAVCRALGMRSGDIYISRMGRHISLFRRNRDEHGSFTTGAGLHYSRAWDAGGRLIDAHLIAVSYDAGWDPEDHGLRWFAQSPKQEHLVYGSTALEAACRCFVLMTLGPVVNLPKILAD